MCHPEQTADLIGPYPVSVLRQLRHRGDSSSSCKRWSQDTRIYVLCTQRQVSDEVIVLQLRAWVRDNSPAPGSGVRYMNSDLVFVNKVTNLPVPRMAGNSLTRRTILSVPQVRRYSLELLLIHPIYSPNLRLQTSRAWSPEKLCRKPRDYGQLNVNHAKSGFELQAIHKKHITLAKRYGPWQHTLLYYIYILHTPFQGNDLKTLRQFTRQYSLTLVTYEAPITSLHDTGNDNNTWHVGKYNERVTP